MKKAVTIFIILALLFLTACAKPIDLSIGKNAEEITGRNENTYTGVSEDDTYCYVVINGEIFLPFGTQDSKITGDIIGECIAYEKGDSNSRYYEVKGHPEFVASFYTSGIMEQWEFFRSEKTLGEDIVIPSFIYDLDYEIWK